MARKKTSNMDRKMKSWQNSRVFSYLSAALAVTTVCLGMGYGAKFYRSESRREPERVFNAVSMPGQVEKKERMHYSNIDSREKDCIRKDFYAITERLLGPILRSLDERIFGK